MAKSYFEKLRDPRWQKKRLEIMQRADFSCRRCGSKDKTLNVHHGYYERETEPWEYPDDTLWCLCEDCHEHTQKWLESIHRVIATVFPERISVFYGTIVESLVSHPWELTPEISRIRQSQEAKAYVAARKAEANGG